MSQRHKKKASQTKKRYYDSKAKAEQQYTTRQQNQVTQKPKPVETAAKQASPVKVEASDDSIVPPSASTLPGVYGDHDQKRYSKRKIVSNWDRYSPHDGISAVESEDELQRRFIQLLNLPATTRDSHYSEWDEAGLPTETQDKGSFLKLDCEALSSAFSTLPLHKQLDLNAELWEVVGEESNDAATELGAGSMPEQQSLLHGALSFSNMTPEHQTIDLSSCKAKPFNFDISTLQTNSLSNVMKERDLSTENHPVPGLESTPLPPPIASCEGVVVNSASDTGSEAENCEEETLDLLLATEKSRTAAVLSGSDVRLQTSSVNTSNSPDTQALNDMLDELLA